MRLLNVSTLESAYNTINSHVKHQKHMPLTLIASRASSLWMHGTTVTLLTCGLPSTTARGLLLCVRNPHITKAARDVAFELDLAGGYRQL
jgi:hypothetical protein